MADKLYINWQEFHQDTKALAEKIRAHGKFDKIIAISRGGLIPAGILAYELDIRNSQAINISSYDTGEIRRADEDVEIDCDISDVDEHTLVVDDLSDSGRTFRLMRQLLPQAKFVAVYVKEQGRAEADIYTRQVPDTWVVFPWDVE